jgi:hypothetical protein
MIEQKVLVHNKFEIQIIDAKTGKKKETAVAYNIITDKYFACRMDLNQFYWNCYWVYFYKYIAFGSGTGIPAVTDTAMFTLIDKVATVNVETVYGYPTSYRQVKATLNADQFNGRTITEVGIMGDATYQQSLNTYHANPLFTHAMLKDSEGNPISISKTEADVIVITATFYVTHTPSGFGTNAIYPEAINNDLLKWALSDDNTPTNLECRFTRFTLPYSSDMRVKQIYSGAKTMDLLAGTLPSTGRRDMPMITILNTEFPGKVIKHLGSPGVGAFTFPNHDVFPPYAIIHLPIGTGDAVTKEFNILTPVIMEGSMHVYVNSVEVIEGVDYTVDYENNCIDTHENYYTAGMTPFDDKVTFGNFKDATKNVSTYYYYCDPLAFWSNYSYDQYPSMVTISSTYPAKFDFGSNKKCNILKFESITIPSDQLDNMKVQYSSDGITGWTDVAGLTRSGQVYKFTGATARYWRFYINAYTWSYGLQQSMVTRDGVLSGTTCFLGYTSPGLHFINAPVAGVAIDASYNIDIPYHTANNLLKFTYSFVLSRG